MRFRIKCLTKKEKNNFDLKVDRGLKTQLSNIITKMLIISMNSCSNVNKNDIYEIFSNFLFLIPEYLTCKQEISGELYGLQEQRSPSLCRSSRTECAGHSDSSHLSSHPSLRSTGLLCFCRCWVRVLPRGHFPRCPGHGRSSGL